MTKYRLGKYILNTFQDNEDTYIHYLQANRDSIAEQDTVSQVALQKATSAIPHKAAINLSMAVRRIIVTGITRLQEPQPEGLFTRGLRIVRPETMVLGALPILTLTSTLGLLIVSLCYSLPQYGSVVSEFFFLLGLLLIFVPNMSRLLSPVSSRIERMCLLCVVGICFYLVQLMLNPLYFAGFDEMLHWRTAQDIARSGHLLNENSMLPVSPYYPGLEIMTNALSTISGLSTFHAGNLVLIIARLLMILSLFMFYEQITKSGRMAGIATIIYMTNPHFLFFDSGFSYESLALPLATFMLYILARYETVNKNYRLMIFTAYIALAAVTVTHHMTDYVLDGLLILWTVVSLFETSSRNMRRNLATIALFAILLSLAYAFLLKGNPVSQYLFAYFKSAFSELGRIIAGTSTARPLFTNRAVSPAPIWDRLLGTASVALVAFGLPFGLLSLWQQHRHDALAAMFGIVSFAYPLSQVFRFTNFGSEITDRAAAFLFLSIAYVLTIFIVHFWPTRKLNWKATSLITGAISVMLVGGVIIAAGPGWSDFSRSYKVVDDSRSIEPEGIQAASWASSYLGPDNRVGTDRINQMLMSTFGYQRIVTSLDDNVDISSVFFSSQFGPQEVAILRQARLRYLVVDLRLSTSLPVIGFYFETDEPDAFRLTSPISRGAITKFNTIPQINRVFDSGDIVIYDTGAFLDGSSH